MKMESISAVLKGLNKTRNPAITSIVLANNNSINLTALRRILSDFHVNEVKFTEVQNINNYFKSTVSRLEKDNIYIRFE